MLQFLLLLFNISDISILFIFWWARVLTLFSFWLTNFEHLNLKLLSKAPLLELP